MLCTPVKCIVGLHSLVVPVVLLLSFAPSAQAGRIVGRLTDSWGNGLHESYLWARGAGTNGTAYGDGFSWGGDYTIENLPGGTYFLAANSHGALRHVFVDNIAVPGSGDVTLNVQHRATMATDGNPAGITSLGQVLEYGQTFVATGIELHRVMAMAADTPHRLCRATIHENGPGGTQIGPHRDQYLGQVFPAFYSWGPGEVPLKPGQTYYVRIRSLLGQMFTPIVAPLEDQYPNGHLFMDNVAYPQYDAYLTIACRDDGLVYDMDHYTGWRTGRYTSVGQTFRALGRELRLASFLLANTGDSFPMVVRVHTAPGGPQIGPTKTARMSANVPGTAVWGPGEVPLTPDSTYYIELRRADNGTFAIYGDQGGYPGGQAYLDGQPINEDLRLTLVSSEPTLPGIQISNVMHGDLLPLSARVSWNSNIAAHGFVEFWSGAVPPAVPVQGFAASQQMAHSVTLTGLSPATTYSYRVVNWREGYSLSRSAIGQFTTAATTGTLTGTITGGGNPLAGANVVFSPGNHRAKTAGNGTYTLTLPAGTYQVTVNAFGYAPAPAAPVTVSAGQTTVHNADLAAVTNLVVNGGFESGLTGWIAFNRFDGAQGNGAWSVPSNSGNSWAGNVSNGSGKTGGLYQQVSAVPGAQYALSAFGYTRCTGATGARHGHAQVRIGLDHTGGTNPDSITVIWSRPVFTSEQWRPLTVSGTATGSLVTVFVETVYHDWWGVPVWYIAGFDDVSLIGAAIQPSPTPTRTVTPTPTPVEKNLITVY